MKITHLLFLPIFFLSCNLFSSTQSETTTNNVDTSIVNKLDSLQKDTIVIDSNFKKHNIETVVQYDTSKYSIEQLLRYAKSLIGVPYKYASTNPSVGLDCSGFITNVFNHFGKKVPRSSIDFTKYGTTIDSSVALPGDLILFTGTDTLSKVVGHMGILINNPTEPLLFIHSSSGKANGVTITPLNVYYKKRFVKIIRLPN